MEGVTLPAVRWHSRLRFIIKGLLVLALLIAHFLTRQQTARTMFQQVAFYHYTNNYPDCFRNSLGLLAGQGFRRIGFPGDHPTREIGTGESTACSKEPAECLEAKPVVDFINLQRLELSRDEFDAYLKTPQAEPTPANFVDAIRILDIRFTAFLWKIFGISWPVYYTCASLASTFTCWLIFLIARRLTGSHWTGILAGILFLAFPFENQHAIRSVRDISPLWFATFAFAFFIFVVDSFRARKWNCLSYLILGALATIGMGWRQDALLVAPFLLVGLMALILSKRRDWRPSLVAACLFVSGAGFTYGFVHSLGPREVQTSGGVFHVALYGEASRYNLMGLENSLQIPREDYQTVCNAAWFHHSNHAGTPFGYLDERYRAACRDMYIAAMKYHLFQYIRYWPEFYGRGLGALSQSGQLQAEDLVALRQSRLPWALPLYDWCLDYLIEILPFLHLVGILTFFWVGRDQIRGTFLILFSVYYSVIWLAALPEQKHFGQMILPLAVTGAMGLWGLARALSFLFLRFDLRDVNVVIPKQVRVAAWAVLSAAACWLLACIISFRYSVRQRDKYMNEITALATRAVDSKECIRHPRVFSTFIDARIPNRPRGYILTIQAGPSPALLTCRHVQFPTLEMQGRIFVTHHKLHPGRGQDFAISCVHSQAFGGDVRPYVCTVTVPPGCSIVGCKQLDLSSWKRLPFSTVFCEGEHLPGSPIVGQFYDGEPPSDPYFARYTFNNLSSEVAYNYPWHLLTEFGLPFEESNGSSNANIRTCPR